MPAKTTKTKAKRKSSAPKRKSTRKKAPASTSNSSGLFTAFLAGAMIVGCAWVVTWWINHANQYEHFAHKAQNLQFHFDKSSSKHAVKPTAAISHPLQQQPHTQAHASKTTTTKKSSSVTHHSNEYILYLANYKDFHKADNQRAYLILNGYTAKLSQSKKDHHYWIYLGPYQALSSAKQTQNKLKSTFKHSQISSWQ